MDKTMTQHTPGPWLVHTLQTASENHKGYRITNGAPAWWHIATVSPIDERGREGMANANLLAAAPAMLNALRSLLRYAERQNEVLAQERGGRFVDDGPLGMARDALRLAVSAA